MDAYKDKAIRQKYSAALMSNHKWRKLFAAMADYAPELCGIEYRFTDTEKVHVGSAPFKVQVWETAIDDPVGGAGGPVEYKHIESISIPHIYKYRKYEGAPLSERVQRIDDFLIVLQGIGQFPIFKELNYVVIKGYEPT